MLLPKSSFHGSVRHFPEIRDHLNSLLSFYIYFVNLYIRNRCNSVGIETRLGRGQMANWVSIPSSSKRFNF
jgi:hypothetical protein